MLENIDNLRKNIYGNEIKKDSFIDNPILNNSFWKWKFSNLNKSENEKIVEVVNVESYKKIINLWFLIWKKKFILLNQFAVNMFIFWGLGIEPNLQYNQFL